MHFQSKALTLPSTEMNAKPLLTSAEVPQGCRDQWLYLTAGQLQTAKHPTVLLLSLFPGSVCSHLRCTAQCCLQCWLRGYPVPECCRLPPRLCIHISFQKEPWHTAGWYATKSHWSLQQGYNSSSKVGYPMGITHIGFFVARSVFRVFKVVMAALH